MKTKYVCRGIKNAKMQEAIRDNSRNGNHFFDKDTMTFWGSTVEYGMLPNNAFVTSEDNFDRSRRLFSVRQYDWNTHEVDTITFQQHDDLNEAILYAKNVDSNEKETMNLGNLQQ